MAQLVHARLNTAVEAVRPQATGGAGDRAANVLPGHVRLTVYEDLSAIEQPWRDFEKVADGTVFQSFEWLACWQHHIGVRAGVRPAIVVGHDAAGDILFLLPLSVRPTRVVRELAWLGSDLCDYNGPILAPDFSARVDRAQFLALWHEITGRLRANPRLRYHLLRLTKMPAQVGAQPNPMLDLPVTINPNGAYLTRLSNDWETFYATKRSSSTRRRDRTKRKRLGDLGSVQLVEPTREPDILATLDTLMAQKARSFARMGVANLFGHQGYREFYRALATDAASKPFVHVSRLDVGNIPAAINLGLCFNGRYYHLLASYDDGDASRFGPGAAHLHDLMRLAIERGMRMFDFTIGDESYKRDWCDTELTLYDHISAADGRGALFAWPMIAVQRLKHTIKKTPALWSLFSTARAWLGTLRRH
jgi:CelD/BcsL family acetyltransferase involved in cellulose biosynthesis